MKTKNILILICTLLLVFTFCFSASADEEIVINKTNINEIISAAQKGDPAAIETLKKSDMFDRDKVNKALQGIVFSSNDPEKTIVFDDGSYITVKLSSERAFNKIVNGNISGNVTPNAIIYDNTGTLTVEYAGNIVKYTITCNWRIYDGYNSVTYNWSRDSAWSLKPLFWAEALGTKPLQTNGSKVVVKGTVHYWGSTGEGWDSYLFTGYPDASCTMELCN